MQRNDTTEDRFTPVSSRAVLRDDPGAYLHFLTNVEDSCEDRTTGYTAFELVHLRSWLIHVERSDDDEAWVGCKVPHGDGNALDDVLYHSVNIVLQLRRYGDDGRRFRDRS